MLVGPLYFDRPYRHLHRTEGSAFDALISGSSGSVRPPLTQPQQSPEYGHVGSCVTAGGVVGGGSLLARRHYNLSPSPGVESTSHCDEKFHHRGSRACTSLVGFLVASSGGRRERPPTLARRRSWGVGNASEGAWRKTCQQTGTDAAGKRDKSLCEGAQILGRADRKRGRRDSAAEREGSGSSWSECGGGRRTNQIEEGACCVDCERPARTPHHYDQETNTIQPVSWEYESLPVLSRPSSTDRAIADKSAAEAPKIGLSWWCEHIRRRPAPERRRQKREHPAPQWEGTEST